MADQRLARKVIFPSRVSMAHATIEAPMSSSTAGNSSPCRHRSSALADSETRE